MFQTDLGTLIKIFMLKGENTNEGLFCHCRIPAGI